MVFINKLSAATLFAKAVSIHDIEVMMAPAIIFKILPGALPIRDMEDSYVRVTAMVNNRILFDITNPISNNASFIFKRVNIQSLIILIEKI